MPKKKKQESALPESPLDLPEDRGAETTTLVESGNGERESESQTELVERADLAEQTEEPAKMKVQIEGTASAVRAAARKVANSPAQRPAPPPSEPEEPPDNTDELLADPRNMVVVRRQLPKSVELGDGRRIRTGTKMPEPYSCPTTREEIENDVFDNYGGYKYKCSIHPATTNGENTLLGAFTIEHPDGPDTMPIVEGLDLNEQQTQVDPRTALHTSSGDSTMRDTDPYAKMRQEAELRLDRAKAKKDALLLEAEAKKMEAEIERIGKADAAPVVPPGESDEVRKLREQVAEKDRQLAEKKIDDRFAMIQNSILELTKTVTTLATTKPAVVGEDPTLKFIMKKMDNDATQINTLMTALTAKAPAPVHTTGDDLDKFLSRAEKLKAITGGGEKSGGRLSEVENRLIDIAWEKLNGGDEGGGGDENEDIGKLAVKEFAPILKSFVDKKMAQEASTTGAAPSPERENQIREEAAKFAVQKIAESLHAQGIQLTTGPDGKLLAITGKPTGKVTVPPRHAGTKVMSSQQTQGGLVKKIAITPTDLMNKTEPEPKPEAEAPTEGGEVTHGVFPMLGDGGTTLKIKFPIHPGEMKYDRKTSVDFVLAGIRSEIRQQFPQKADAGKQVESYVPSDAIEFLDEDLLNKLEAIDSGPQLETLLAESGGDRAQIDEIKKSGEDEVVASFLRRIIKTIQTEWAVQKRQGK
jgi:hypothetical protein